LRTRQCFRESATFKLCRRLSGSCQLNHSSVPIEDLPLDGIGWVIVGGESGPHARPMREEWVHSILRQCRGKGVAFFFKQWGGTRKNKTGRVLNGETYDEMPAGSLSAATA
jgi:protein gp37